MRSRQDRTCLRNAGGGTGLLGSSWFEVAVITDEAAAPPGLVGGVMTMTGIEAIPEPMVLDRTDEGLGDVSAVPVLKSIAA
jgi:hypothetical protein